MLICPKCQKVLNKTGRSFVCEEEHSYDIAKRGYVNLLLGNHKQSGDDKEMIHARTHFLQHGYYRPLQDKLVQILCSLDPKVLVDAGCGEGYYTNTIADALPKTDIYGFDLSKAGVDEACKAHTHAQYVVANVFHMPLANECADAVLSVFAPYALDEIHRVLKNKGYFVKVGPAPKHLLEMKKIIYDQIYENEIEEIQDERFQKIDEYSLQYTFHIMNKEDIHALFQMTPYYWKSPKEGSERLLLQEALECSAHFQIEVYKIQD